MRPPRRLDFVLEAAEGIEQRPVRRGVDQRAVVVLAMDLDQLPADRLHQSGTDRLVVDEGAGAAVGVLHAPHDQVGVVGDLVLAQGDARRMLGRQLQHGDHLPALGPVAHQRSIAAAAKRQRQRVEEDRLCRRPVSPVSAVSPPSSPRSSWSISTMLRTERALSTRGQLRAGTDTKAARDRSRGREQNSNC